MVIDRRLRRRLLSIHTPDELDVQRRAWSVVRAAFAEREPTPRRRQLVRPLIALAVALAVVGGIVNPPVLNALRDAIGREKHVPVYRPALFSLPGSGRLLVNSARGPWIVNPDGSKRLLGPYHDASWSPRGLYVAAVGAHELVALTPKGVVRWTLARSGRIGSPRWSPEHAGSTRIAYLRNATLRVVAGDETGDRLIGPAAQVAPAWRPGTGFVVAYADPTRRIRIVDANSGKLIRRLALLSQLIQLAWSSDGQQLLALAPRSVTFFDRNGRRIRVVEVPGRAVTAAFEPGSHRVAVVVYYPDSESSAAIRIDGTRKQLIFAADGSFTDGAWSPDGRWLLLGWKSADAWMFVSRTADQKVISDVSRQFGSGEHPSGAFPAVPQQGWCCHPTG